MDVEEHPGGAVSNYIAISDVVTQMQERVNAMRACHSYYISLAYTQVWGRLCNAAVLLSALHACCSRELSLMQEQWHSTYGSSQSMQFVILHCMPATPAVLPRTCANGTLPGWQSRCKVAGCDVHGLRHLLQP